MNQFLKDNEKETNQLKPNQKEIDNLDSLIAPKQLNSWLKTFQQRKSRLKLCHCSIFPNI